MSEEIKVSDEAREIGVEIYTIYEVRTDYECTCFSKPEDPCSFCNGWAKAKKEGTERIQLILNQRDTKIAALEAEVGELRMCVDYCLKQAPTINAVKTGNFYLPETLDGLKCAALNSTKGEK